MTISYKNGTLPEAQRESHTSKQKTPKAFKKPTQSIGGLIDLVSCLPRYDSLEFKLLHPAVVQAEDGWPLDVEAGLMNPEFAQEFHSMFERSTQEITNSTRSRGFDVFGCGFWSTHSGECVGEFLTSHFRRVRGLCPLDDVEIDDNSDPDDYLFCKTMMVDGNEVDWTPGRWTEHLVRRFRLPTRLLDFIANNPPFNAWKWMTDLYEAFYLLHDIAYLNESGQRTSSVRSPGYSSDSKLLIDDHGFLRHGRSLFWGIIQECDVEAGRIRACKVCRRIFWAGRSNQRCCSTACTNVFHVHNFRYKTPEEKAAYTLRRIQRERRTAGVLAGSTKARSATALR